MIKNKIIGSVVFTFCAIHTALAVDPNFELWNKTQYAIKAEVGYFNVMHKEKIQKTSFIQPNARFHLYGVDMERKMLITINNTDRYHIDSCAEYDEEYGICHKTAYLSYDKTGLRPQQGKWHGLAGITMSGYDNTKNIGEDKIHGIQILLED